MNILHFAPKDHIVKPYKKNLLHFAFCTNFVFALGWLIVVNNCLASCTFIDYDFPMTLNSNTCIMYQVEKT